MHMFFRHLTVLIAALFGFIAVLPAVSQEAQTIGVGRLFANDILGDGQERWHTMSNVVSVMGRTDTYGHTPAVFGQPLEHRLRGEIIAPSNLENPSAEDRPYAGVPSFGVHTHSMFGDVQNRVGLDGVAIGPQTGVNNLHNLVHDGLNIVGQDVGTQLRNAIYPTLSGEVARSAQMGKVQLRPFAEAQYGVEIFAGIGADVTIGNREMNAVRLRDATSGQLYQPDVKDQAHQGVELLLGADVAHVWTSEYMPAAQGYVVEPVRFRGRAGVQLSAPHADMFYGVTWLGPEFEGQSSGQVVGSLNVNLRF